MGTHDTLDTQGTSDTTWHTFLVALNGFLVATHGVQRQTTRIPQQRRFPVRVCLLLRAHLPLVSLVLQCGVQLFFRGMFCLPQHQRLLEIFQPCKKTQDFKETVHVRICGCFCIRFLYTVLPSSVTLRVIFQSVVQLPPLLKRVRVMRVQSNGIGQILGWGGSVVVRVVLCVRKKTTQTETMDTFG